MAAQGQGRNQGDVTPPGGSHDLAVVHCYKHFWKFLAGVSYKFSTDPDQS